MGGQSGFNYQPPPQDWHHRMVDIRQELGSHPDFSEFPDIPPVGPGPSYPCPDCKHHMVPITRQDGRKFLECTRPGCGGNHMADDQGYPIGIPGNRWTRMMRGVAHERFDAIWKGHPYGMGRNEAYKWLSEVMGLPIQEAHFSMFDAQECTKVIDIIDRTFPKRTSSSVMVGMLRMAVAADTAGAHDLADRMERLAQASTPRPMVRLSLTGRELAELYALEAMGVPSDYYEQSGWIDEVPSPEQRSYLIDTEEGQEILLNHAHELAEKIQETNWEWIQDYINDEINSSTLDEDDEEAMASIRPHSSVLYHEAVAFLDDQMHEAGLPGLFGRSLNDENKNETEWWKSPQLRMDYASRALGMVRTSQTRPSWEEIDDNEGRIEEAIGDFAHNVGTELDEGKWTDLIWSWWETAKMRNPADPEETISSFMDSLRTLAEDQGFQDSFWPHHFKQHKDDFEREYIDNLREDDDQIYNRIYDPDDAHFAIQDAVNDLESKAYQANNSGKREDYLAVMQAIDHLSSMSHHGGPAFEYGDTTNSWMNKDDGGPDLTEVMNRKFGDRFIPWLLASGNFPEEHMGALQQWYDEQSEGEGHEAYQRQMYDRNRSPEGVGRAIDRETSSEGYYKHPYYSQRDRWLAQHSPTYQAWTPFDEDVEDQANIQSVARSAYDRDEDSPRQRTMQTFLDQRNGPRLMSQPDIIDPRAVRPRWVAPDLTADIAIDMVRSAHTADAAGAHDLADRMDRLVLALDM